MKISGRVVSKRPISLSRAAKLISRFAAVENGSSPVVSLYLQQAADAFNQLVQFHDKRSKLKNHNNFDAKNIHTDSVRESEKQIVNDGGAAEAPPKKKKKGKKEGKSGEASLKSENIETEKDSENVERESVKEIINGDTAEAPARKKRKRDDAKNVEKDSEEVLRESVKEEIIKDGDSATKKKKKKRKS